MSIITNFGAVRMEDGTLTIEMVPAEPIGGWSLQFSVKHRFGGETNLITKVGASGFYLGESGVQIVNSGQGIFNVRLNAVDTSGFDFKNYAFLAERMDSGYRTTLAEGFITLTP